MSNTFSEITEVFKYLQKDILDKIPIKLRNFIEENKNKEYQYTYEPTKELKDQQLMKETKYLISALYLNYCCDEETKNHLIKNMKQDEINYIKIKNGDEMFKKPEKKVQQENNAIVEIKEKGFFGKLIDKIKAIFHIGRGNNNG